MPLYVGLMSGTSLDAIDAALVAIDDDNILLRGTLSYPLPEPLHAELVALTTPGENEVERLGCADRQLGQAFAGAVKQLLQTAGVDSQAIRAIGSHGQTIRHRPPSPERSTTQAFSLQIGDPNTLALETGITTVADFRRRDIAAGGQGAPLAPAFHRQVFHSHGVNRAIVNIGGMANVSLISGEGDTLGFDCGPGNILMDSWIQQRQNKPFDRDGQWAAGGHCHPELLEHLLAHPFFSQKTGARSTGREDFHLDMLQQHLAELPDIDDRDIQATLLELTANTVAMAITTLPTTCDEVYICGGGAYNLALMHRLEQLLTPRLVATTQHLGLAPEWVEATAFAWLAHRCMQGLPGNDPRVTGAREAVILGGIYPA